jgi:hypothetical protein
MPLGRLLHTYTRLEFPSAAAEAVLPYTHTGTVELCSEQMIPYTGFLQPDKSYYQNKRQTDLAVRQLLA